MIPLFGIAAFSAMFLPAICIPLVSAVHSASFTWPLHSPVSLSGPAPAWCPHSVPVGPPPTISYRGLRPLQSLVADPVSPPGPWSATCSGPCTLSFSWTCLAPCLPHCLCRDIHLFNLSFSECIATAPPPEPVATAPINPPIFDRGITDPDLPSNSAGDPAPHGLSPGDALTRLGLLMLVVSIFLTLVGIGLESQRPPPRSRRRPIALRPARDSAALRPRPPQPLPPPRGAAAST